MENSFNCCEIETFWHHQGEENFDPYLRCHLNLYQLPDCVKYSLNIAGFVAILREKNFALL